MKPGIDLSTATRAERVVLVLGFALFVNALLPWWYRVDTGRETFLHNGGLYGWGIVAALAGFASVTIVVARHVQTPAGFGDRSMHMVLGVMATVGLGIHGFGATSSLWIGYWLELALSASLAVAGILRIRERGRGWV